MTHTNRKTNDVETRTGKGWEMRLGRWQESPPEEVDHVISDPPFDERSHKNGRRGSTDGVSTSAPKSFPPVDPRSFAPGLIEVARRWVVCFCAVEQLGRYRDAVGDDRYLRSGAWVKPNPTPQFTGDRPGVWGEGIAIMHSRDRHDDGTLVEAPRWNCGGHAAIWRHPPENGSVRDGREHETQKPLPLMVDLIEAFTNPGDLIWDPYAGSATTGVAAILTGRRFLGHEMQAGEGDDEPYFQVACERLEAESRGLKLKDAQAGQTSLLEVAE